MWCRWKSEQMDLLLVVGGGGGAGAAAILLLGGSVVNRFHGHVGVLFLTRG